MKPVAFPKVSYELIRLAGGLDQATPTLSLKPGMVRRGSNFECAINGGYARIAGYERFDGRANPSDAVYSVLTVSLIAPAAIGDTITGATSGATAKIIAQTDDTVVVTRQTGLFIFGEGATISAVPVGTIDEVSSIHPDGLTDAQYRSAAAEEYRASIGAVPGEGSILGVAFYDGELYAWRNAVGGASAKIHRATSAGWVEVALGTTLAFTLGTAEISEGQTVTGFTSGATGVVARVVLSTGGWSGTGAGQLVLSSSTGTFVAAEKIRVGGADKATASGAAAQITIAPDGRVRTQVANFGGGSANRRMYGCDGVNRAFEFDGTTYTPITTTMSPDIPTCIAVHKQRLFLAFGSSLQFSGSADPYRFEAVIGAGEIAMNGEIEELLSLPGDQTSGALAVYTKSDTSVLYGSTSEDFSLSQFNVGTGGMAYTGQNLDQCYVLSDRGVMALGATLNFGNFASAAMTMNMRPYLKSRLRLASASVVCREKGQYRLFFSDGYALYMTISNGKFVGGMPVQFPVPVLCTTEGETAAGAETSFFGSDTGYVYRLEAGTSFDGEEIQASLTLVYNAINSPRVTKRYRRASVEVTGDAYAEFAFGYDLGYGTDQIEQASDAVATNDLRSAYWDSMQWDDFIFDGRELSPSEIEMTGSAENIAVRISAVSSILRQFTVNSIIIHYTQRRGLR